VSELDRTFAALSDPTRRRVVDLLRKRPRAAGELARAFGLSPPAMSRHLRTLRHSGLVEEDHGGEDARVRVYRLRREPFGELRGWLDDVEAFWAAELESFKVHVERTRPKGKALR
jgi:DNA-binding transcriptional ArsR family regulator